MIDEPPATPIGVPYQALVHADDPEPTLTSHAVAAAATLQLDLLGASEAHDNVGSANAFLPRKRHRGLCRACGRSANMSFEHLPPAASGNNTRTRGTSALRILTSDEPTTFPASGWFASQRGVGAYVLCKPCNEFFGHKYVRSYIAFSKAVGLGAINAIRERGNGTIPGFVDINLEGWELGDIAREGLVQLLGLGVHDRLIRRFPVLSSIVLTGEGELPSELRLGLTLILNTAQGRVSSPMMSVKHAGQPIETVTLFSEVSMAPFSWTLSFTGDGRPMVDRAADVSNWLTMTLGKIAGPTSLALPVGTIESSVPGDFSFGGRTHA